MTTSAAVFAVAFLVARASQVGVVGAIPSPAIVAPTSAGSTLDQIAASTDESGDWHAMHLAEAAAALDEDETLAALDRRQGPDNSSLPPGPFPVMLAPSDRRENPHPPHRR